MRTSLLKWIPLTFVLSLFLYLLGSVFFTQKSSVRYVTWSGSGPDKWASAWFISRFVDQDSSITVVERESPIQEGDIGFDIPNGEYQRAPGKTTLDSLLREHSGDPAVQKLAAVLHDIEINFWKTNELEESFIVEKKFRQLQAHFNNSVSQQCYFQFFDNVHQFLTNQNGNENDLALPKNCDTNQAIDDYRVEQLSMDSVLSEMAADKKVVFVDARELYEFELAHIPGAIRMPIRDVSKQSVEIMSQADRVIAYCVKDFRGYELAKALSKAGVKNVAIMNPFGLKGWISNELPVVGTKGLTEQSANEILAERVKYLSTGEV